MANFAKESTRHHANCIVILWNKGYNNMSKFYTLLPDGINYLKQGNSALKDNMLFSYSLQNIACDTSSDYCL